MVKKLTLEDVIVFAKSNGLHIANEVMKFKDAEKAAELAKAKRAAKKKKKEE